MPMRLDDGWNQIQFNLSDFTRRAYGTNYIETLRVQENFQKKMCEEVRKNVLGNCMKKVQKCGKMSEKCAAHFP